MKLPALLKHYPAIRSWIYGVLPPLGLLLSTLGYTTDTTWALIAGVITAALPGGLAFTNRPTSAATLAGLTEIQNAAIAQAIAMMLVPEKHPEAFPPAVEAPDGEVPYVEEG